MSEIHQKPGFYRKSGFWPKSQLPWGLVRVLETNYSEFVEKVSILTTFRTHILTTFGKQWKTPLFALFDKTVKNGSLLRSALTNLYDDTTVTPLWHHCDHSGDTVTTPVTLWPLRWHCGPTVALLWPNCGPTVEMSKILGKCLKSWNFSKILEFL